MGGKRLRKDSTAMLVHLSFCVFVDKQTVTCTRVQHFFHMTNIGLFYAVSVGPEEHKSSWKVCCKELKGS